jgi:hypothetical protein
MTMGKEKPEADSFKVDETVKLGYVEKVSTQHVRNIGLAEVSDEAADSTPANKALPSSPRMQTVTNEAFSSDIHPRSSGSAAGIATASIGAVSRRDRP